MSIETDTFKRITGKYIDDNCECEPCLGVYSKQKNTITKDEDISSEYAKEIIEELDNRIDEIEEELNKAKLFKLLLKNIKG